MSRRKKPSGNRAAFKGSQDDLVKLLRRLGYDVEVSGGGHYKVHCPKGIVVMSRTPSDPLAPRNNLHILRRYGVPI